MQRCLQSMQLRGQHDFQKYRKHYAWFVHYCDNVRLARMLLKLNHTSECEHERIPLRKKACSV